VQWAPGIPHALIRAEDKGTTRAHRVARRERVFRAVMQVDPDIIDRSKSRGADLRKTQSLIY
jgi:hypothetical protein